MDGKTWILWDGTCGFCRRAVTWFGRRDKAHQFTVVPYQEAPSPPMTPELYAACERAVHVVKPDGTILRAGRATLFILEHIGWGWVARLLMLPPFIWIVELGYAIVARHRDFFSNFLFRKG